MRGISSLSERLDYSSPRYASIKSLENFQGPRTLFLQITLLQLDSVMLSCEGPSERYKLSPPTESHLLSEFHGFGGRNVLVGILNVCTDCVARTCYSRMWSILQNTMCTCVAMNLNPTFHNCNCFNQKRIHRSPAFLVLGSAKEPNIVHF